MDKSAMEGSASTCALMQLQCITGTLCMPAARYCAGWHHITSELMPEKPHPKESEGAQQCGQSVEVLADRSKARTRFSIRLEVAHQHEQLGRYFSVLEACTAQQLGQHGCIHPCAM